MALASRGRIRRVGGAQAGDRYFELLTPRNQASEPAQAPTKAALAARIRAHFKREPGAAGAAVR